MTSIVPWAWPRGVAALLVLSFVALAQAYAAGADPAMPSLDNPSAAGSSQTFDSAKRNGLKIQKGDTSGDSWFQGRRLQDTLYGAADEVPGIRIGWYIDDTIEAFRTAIERNQPFILLIEEDWCGYCWQMVDSFTCPAVNSLAGSAVFAVGSPEREKGVMAIASSLGIDAYPTVTVLHPEARMLIEAGRLNGYFKGELLAKHLETIRQVYPRSDQEFGLPAPWMPVTGVSQAKRVLTPLSKTPQFEPEC